MRLLETLHQLDTPNPTPAPKVEKQAEEKRPRRRKPEASDE
jgi:hypothetical protein